MNNLVLKDEPRRLARISNKRAMATNPERISSSITSDVSQEGSREEKRRRLGAGASIRPWRFPKKGCLEPLLNLSIKVIWKIASFLFPKDLLTMARSCKTLRNFFMLKASAHVWAASREALNIPDCPPDLSEPQYVDLLFMKGCYLCKARLAKIVRFPFRLRLCMSCDEKMCVLGTSLVELDARIGLGRVGYAKISDVVYDDDDWVARISMRKYADLIPSIEILSSCGAQGCNCHRMFYRPQLVEMRSKVKAMSKEEYRAFYETNIDQVEQKKEHAKLVQSWLDTYWEGIRKT